MRVVARSDAGLSQPRQREFSFSVPPGQSNTIHVTYAAFAAVGNNVFKSNHGGITWLGIGSALPPGPAYSLVSDPNYPQLFYAATYTRDPLHIFPSRSDALESPS